MEKRESEIVPEHSASHRNAAQKANDINTNTHSINVPQLNLCLINSCINFENLPGRTLQTGLKSYKLLFTDSPIGILPFELLVLFLFYFSYL